jgi:hypothetical protein
MILHVLHIAGKRMKASGVDGLSQGDHTRRHDERRGPHVVPPFSPGGGHPIRGESREMGPELVEDRRQGLGPWARARLGKSPLGGDYSLQHV